MTIIIKYYLITRLTMFIICYKKISNKEIS